MSDEISYEATNFDGTERRGNYRLIAFRQDILRGHDNRDAAAIIFQIVYRWQTEFKRPQVLKVIEERKKAGQPPLTEKEVEDMMYVHMSYNDFVREAGGALGYNTVVRAIDYLVHEKCTLLQRENSNPKFTDLEYAVNLPVLKDLLQSLPAEPDFQPKLPKSKSRSTQMGRPRKQAQTEKSRSTQMGTPSTQMGTPLYPNGYTSHITHSNLTEDTHNNEVTEGSSASAPDPATLTTALQEENQELKALILHLQSKLSIKDSDAATLNALLDGLGNQRPSSTPSTSENQPEIPVTPPAGVEETAAKQADSLSYSPDHAKPAKTSENNKTARPRVSREKAVEKPVRPAKPEPPKPEDVFTADELVCWQNWCGMPWLKGAPQTLTEKAISNMKRQACYGLTKAEMIKVRNWATSPKVDKTGYYKDRGWSHGDLLNETPKWLSTQEPVQGQQPSEPQKNTPEEGQSEKFVLWTRDAANPALQQFIVTPRGQKWYELAEKIEWVGMSISEARTHGWQLAYSMTDHETRYIAHAQERRQQQEHSNQAVNA